MGYGSLMARLSNHRRIEVDPNVVELVPGQVIEDLKKRTRASLNRNDDSALRIIMVISLQRSLPVSNDPTPFASALHRYNDGVQALLSRYAGKTVRQTENYFLLSFQSPSNAVKAAIEIGGLFKNFKKEAQVRELYLKIGLSTGVPAISEKKIIFA